MEPWMIYCERFGEPAEVLTLKRREPPRPQAGEILVRMTASPINPSDLLPVRGAYAHRIALPFVPGYEGVGTVEDVGSGVSRSMIGTRVLPLRGEGTWQELVVSPAEWAVPVPASLEDATASQLYINPVTAWLLCTDVLRLGSGDVLAVNAGGSAIGRIFSQLSTLLGFRLISIVRSDRHTGELISLGAWRVVNTGETDLHDAVTEWTNGNGVTAAVDCVGGRSGADLIACTQPGGAVISIGLLSGEPLNLSQYARAAGVRFELFHLRHWLNRVTPDEWQRTFRTLIRLLEKRQLHLWETDNRFDLTDYPNALFAAAAPGRTGKVLLVRT